VAAAQTLGEEALRDEVVREFCRAQRGVGKCGLSDGISGVRGR